MIPCDHGSDPKTCRLPTVSDASVKCCDKFAATMGKIQANLRAAISAVEAAPATGRFFLDNPVPTQTEGLVQNMNKPEITNPAAKSALELAQALSDMAELDDVVRNMKIMLADAERRLKEARKTCNEKMKSLNKTVKPDAKESQKEKVNSYEYREV